MWLGVPVGMVADRLNRGEGTVDLYLLRHGDAVERTMSDIALDEERSLTEDGRAEARAAAGGLSRLGITLDLVLSSPLVRAWQTAEIMTTILRPTRGLMRCRALAPGGTPEGIVQSLLDIDLPEALLLVGHMPDLGAFAGWLAWGEPAAALTLRTGGLCRITTIGVPRPGGGELRWLLPPRLLRHLR